MAAGSDTWTNGNADRQWDEPLNWLGGDIPGDGHTATFASVVDMPNANLPGGITVNYVFTAGITTTISGMVGAASAIGAVTVNHASAVITAGANITGAITITDGVLVIAAARTLSSTVAVATDGYLDLDLDASGTVVASDTITLSGSATLAISSVTTLDIAATKSLTGTGFVDNAGTIQGTVNMTAAVWDSAGVITVDEDGTLNLGTDADNDQDVTVTATTVTIGDSFRCDSFTLNAVGGTLTVSDKTITVGAGGLVWTAGGVSAAELSIVMAEATAVCNWNTESMGRLKALTVNAAVSLSGAFHAGSLGGTGSLACGAQNPLLRPAAANFFSLAGGMTGTGKLHLYYPAGDYANAAAMNIGTMDLLLYGVAKTLTLNGAVTCADVQSYLACTLSFQAGLTASGNLVLGYTDNTAGHVIFGDGTVNTIAGTVAKSGTDTGHTLDFGSSHTTLGGDVTLAGITPDFGSAYISGAVTIDGTDAGTVANTKAIVVNATVQDLSAPTANPLYVYKDWRREEPEKQVGDNRFPPIPDPALNGLIGTGNTNVEYALVTYDGLWYNRRNRGIRARGRRLAPMGHRRRHLARGRP